MSAANDGAAASLVTEDDGVQDHLITRACDVIPGKHLIYAGDQWRLVDSAATEGKGTLVTWRQGTGYGVAAWSPHDWVKIREVEQ